MYIVTGACGFIGSNLIKTLFDLGEKDIVAVDYVYRDYIQKCPVNFVYADEFLNNLNNFCVEDCKGVFHEGAISSTTENDWKKLWEKNCNYTMKLIYFCRDRDIKLQYASSASVYGNPSKEQWHKKDKPLCPLNLYAKSKQQVDYVAELVMSSIRPPVLLQGMRYFNVYGPNEDHKLDQSSPYHKFKKQFEETGRIKLFEGSENFYRDFISVEDVIQRKLSAFENKQNGIYDIGTSKPKSFLDVALEVGGSHDVLEWIPMPENLREHYQHYSCAIND